ncbi:MAG: hypothetical protein M3362_21610, partial [Acidobacteriota bacterium]|nr:hypothetical protein [Acidobacteriota bacterium]
ILDKEPPPLSTRARASIPAGLEAIVSRALEKKREDRYPKIDVMMNALRSLKQKMEIEAALRGAKDSEQHTEPLHVSDSPAAAADTEGEMRRLTGENVATQTIVSAGAETKSWRKLWTGKSAVVIASLALIGLAAAFGIYKLTRREQALRPNAFANVKLTKLTTNGKAGQAAVSPDGKYAAYVNGERGKQSIVLKHIPTASDQEIVPVTGEDYVSLAFSHDGNYIYYERVGKTQTVLYRVPVLGGIAPAKLSEDVNSIVTLSPDDKRMAFVRGYPQEGTCAVIMANA